MDDIDDLEMELDASNDNEWDETRFQRRMDTVANASANLGKLLLRGWCMLADECQTCHTPLMSLGDSAPKCVLCNPVEQVSQSQPQKKPKPNTQKANEMNELNARNHKLWNNDDAFQKRIKKSQDASAKIGELLLQGWTMLAQHCQQCQTPLMGLRGGEPMCCICDRDAKDAPPITQQKQETKAHAQVQPMKKRMNGMDVERKTNDAPKDGCFGFGPKQDHQLRRTVGDIVKTVLDKMSVINERMSRNKDSLQNDIMELNQLMEFLQNVKQFKTQLAQ